MNNFLGLYFSLSDIQISLLKAMVKTMILQPLVIVKQQVLNYARTFKENYYYIPLTPDQVTYFDHALISKSDLNLEFSYHQLKDIAKWNFDKDIDISQHFIKHQTKTRVFRKVSK